MTCLLPIDLRDATPFDPPEGSTFSVVIPCRNEEANIAAMARAVVAEMEAVGDPFELIFIDNASDDRTVAIARALCAEDARIKLIVNARNFGQMRSPTHAIFAAQGDVIINLCCDFQDPPELIGQFVARWRAGAAIVLGVRAGERSSLPLRVFRGFSYWFAEKFGDYPIIPNATGFGLYDAKVVRVIERLNEPEPFFRGMLTETGFPTETIAYPRPPRAGGRSNNTLFALADFALSSLAGASKRMVRVPFYIGAAMLLIAFVALLGVPVAAVLGEGNWVIGLGAIALIEAHTGLLFLFLGIVGDQVRLISERTRQTPLVIERERVNFG
jgi:glycosyltransferase involved in cell wall biosynthesis